MYIAGGGGRPGVLGEGVFNTNLWIHAGHDFTNSLHFFLTQQRITVSMRAEENIAGEGRNSASGTPIILEMH